MPPLFWSGQWWLAVISAARALQMAATRHRFDALVRTNDHRAVAEAALAAIRTYTNAEFLHDRVTSLAPAIAVLRPNYVVVYPDAVTIEFAGGFDHFGFKVEDKHDIWEMSWYTEKGHHPLPHSLSKRGEENRAVQRTGASRFAQRQIQRQRRLASVADLSGLSTSIIVKTTWIVLAALVALTAASVLGIRSCQRAGWESLLRGPYAGLPFTGDLTNRPVSVLGVPSHGKLEVYELASQSAPVLVLRSDAGAIQWSRVLVPEQRFDNGRVERAGVREVRLQRLERDKHGHAVFFTCDWDWGGKEGGLIDLDSDYGFKSFRISW